MQESLVGHDCPEQTWSRSFVRLRDRRFSLSFPSTALISTHVSVIAATSVGYVEDFELQESRRRMAYHFT